MSGISHLSKIKLLREEKLRAVLEKQEEIEHDHVGQKFARNLEILRAMPAKFNGTWRVRRPLH